MLDGICDFETSVTVRLGESLLLHVQAGGTRLPWAEAGMDAMSALMAYAQPEHLSRALWCAASLGAKAESSGDVSLDDRVDSGAEDRLVGPDGGERGIRDVMSDQQAESSTGRSSSPPHKPTTTSCPLVVQRRWLHR